MLTLEPVAYTYKAEHLCPNCTIEALKADGLAQLYDDSSEETIRLLANRAGIDYSSPFTYNSDDFPKWILASDLDCDSDDDGTEHPQCDGCRASLCN